MQVLPKPSSPSLSRALPCAFAAHTPPATPPLASRLCDSLHRPAVELFLAVQLRAQAPLHRRLGGHRLLHTLRSAAKGHVQRRGRHLPCAVLARAVRGAWRAHQPGPFIAIRNGLGILHLLGGRRHSAAALSVAKAGRGARRSCSAKRVKALSWRRALADLCPPTNR